MKSVKYKISKINKGVAKFCNTPKAVLYYFVLLTENATTVWFLTPDLERINLIN